MSNTQLHSQLSCTQAQLSMRRNRLLLFVRCSVSYLIVKVLNYDYYLKREEISETEQYVNEYVEKLIELGGKA